MRRHNYYLLTLVVLAFVVITGASAQSLNTPYIKEVYEYVPAPGQFINTMPEWEEGDDAAAMARKCQEILADDGMICLGGFGGYVTFGFDHPVVNVPGAYDLFIKGNAFAATDKTDCGSSEPGIVMVSRDDNGNGLPDDKWYELSGSADTDSIGKVVYNYQITYTFIGDKKPVTWTDNHGGKGVMPRNAYHSQEYFPAWLTDQRSLSFTGTLLPNNIYVDNGNFLMRFLRYGYVDNKPNIVDGNINQACCFNIDWAVDADRQPVKLSHVDFVRVYCAMNQINGLLGETSTEFAGAEDLHPSAVPTGITDLWQSDNRHRRAYYDLTGRKVSENASGVIISNGRLLVR
ncbi:MAG: hypothetical protein J6I54_03740 [Bacteroidaceae bacterium]|nr:hypothetical protein [Bacteroidaceae bacterium]